MAYFRSGSSGGTVTKIGTYSSVSTIDVSAYNASSSSEFLAVLSGSTSVVIDEFYWQQRSSASGYQNYSASISSPSLSLSGTTLTITPAKVTGSAGGTYPRSKPNYAPTEVYYVGKIS